MKLATLRLNPLTTLKVFIFFLYGTMAIYSSFFPLFFQEIGLSKVEIGLIMAGGPFISIFANPFWGYWSDRTQNIRRSIIILLVANLLITIMIFQMRYFALIFVVMLIFFFFQSPTYSQSNSLVLTTIEDTKHKFGTFRLWGSLGFALIAVAAGPVVGWFGIMNLWEIYGFMLLVTIGFTLALPREGARYKKKFTKHSYWKVLFLNKYFLVFVVLGVLISVPNSINQTFVSLYIMNLGGTKVMIGWSAFFSAIFEIPVFLLFDRFLKKKMVMMVSCLVFVSLLYAVRWMLMSIVTGPVEIIFIQILHCITYGGYYYVGTIITAHLIPSEFRSTGQALYALTWGGISGITAGILGGWMFDVLGPRTMYEISAVIAMAGVLGFIIMLYRVRKDEHARVLESGNSKGF